VLHTPVTSRGFGGSASRPTTAWFGLLFALCLLFGSTAAPAFPVKPDASEIARFSPLHAAAHRGDMAALGKLIAERSNLEARDGYGRTALHVAAYARQHEAIRTLAAAGADLGAFERDRYDAVTIVGILGDDETLRVLLAAGASAKLVTSIHYGTALIASSHHGHPGVVRQLIAAGAPLDHVNILHWNALIEAVVLGDGGARHQAVLKALLDAGADTRLTDRAGNTPLSLAKASAFDAMVKMLEAAGAR
jgi:ankyrin repeat protein